MIFFQLWTLKIGEMIQFDEHIFQMGGEKPPTSNDLSLDLPQKPTMPIPPLVTTRMTNQIFRQPEIPN